MFPVSGGRREDGRMWITGKLDLSSVKEQLFNELHAECRLAAPGARLSYTLRTKLEKFARDERKDIVTNKKDGCSPLFVACKKGNVDIVEYLIAQCDADAEQRGMYEVPDDRSIHHVTPLWCAAVAGKLAVVKCLVEHGACVNSVSDTGSTPVRSACFMTHLDIVRYLVEHGADIQKPNYNGGTCLINSVQSVPLCEYLLLHGAAVNAQDIQFKTALHYAIQEHRFETTQLLLEHGADPGLRSRYGDDALQTACLKGATQIFEYLTSRVPYTRERTAEAHELMGSTYLDEHHDLPTALKYWRQALDIRGSSPSPVPGPADALHKKPQGMLRPAYWHTVEFQTRSELESLALDLDAMRTQSLLICERILGPLHKDTIFRLMYRGAAYADSLRYQRCIDLWRYALELRIAKDSLLHSESCFTAQALVRLFLDLLEKNATGVLHEYVHYDDVAATIELLGEQLRSADELLSVRPVYKRQQDNFERVLRVLTHLFHILLAIPKDAGQTLRMKRLANRVIRLEPRGANGDTLLHFAVSRANAMKANSSFFDDPHTAVFPNAGVAALLLECGMDANVVNDALSTPLHVAAAAPNYHPGVVDVLLKHGAHIDQCNSGGQRACVLLSAVEECTVNPLHHLTLKCLAAQVVVRHRIPYHGDVPTSLEDFIKIH